MSLNVDACNYLMAILIPAIGTCLPRMTSGERRLAERLEQKLDDDYLLWYDVPVDECAHALNRARLPHQVRKGAGSFHPNEDTIKALTIHASKGLEFPVAALVGVGQMPAAGEDEREEARLFYVGATRATHSLVIGAGGDGGFGKRLRIDRAEG